MRVMIKRKLLRLLDTMQSMHKIIAGADIYSAEGYVEDCRQASEAIEGAVTEHTSGLEAMSAVFAAYRSNLSSLHTCAASGMLRASVLSGLDDTLDQAASLITGLPDTFLVVFMPYKAEMWDSMESIWLACREDPACECRVMPLPYYEYDKARGGWRQCYDGERFPKEVPVTDYRQYSLESACPDLAYIHNPYDDCNYVTSIDPAYYSSELKKYVGKLVYVPYYVTSGFFSQWELPAYRNVDYMIIQSEFVKESMREMHYYHKVLPLGSPKLDKVIQTCRSGARMPEAWRPVLEGRKSLMLNTSINRFLSDGEHMLKKLKLVFDTFKRQNRVALIWRPHPLLEATIRSIRPDLLEEYQSLTADFMDSHIGIWDDTQDITNTVALADGYIGEDATSVVNLFMAAGKPVFILNNFITGSFTQEEKQRFKIADAVSHEGKLWMTDAEYNALVCMEPQDGRIDLADRLKGQPKWKPAYLFMAARENVLYLSPSASGMPMAYDMKTGKQMPLFEQQQDVNLCFQRIFCYGNRIFYVPSYRNPIMEYHCDTKQWKFHDQCMDVLLEKAKEKEWAQKAANRELGITSDACGSGEYLWISAPYTNQLLRFSMADSTYAFFTAGEEDTGYSGMAVDKDCIWLAEVKTRDVVRWDIRTGETRRFRVSGRLSARKWRYDELPYTTGLLNMGQYLVIIPSFSNGIIRFDKAAGGMTVLAAEFFGQADLEANGYCPQYHATCSFAKKMNDTTILVQRCRDGKTAAINVEDNTCTAFYPTLSDEDYGKLTKGEDGFEKIEKKYGFFCYESRIFSLGGFMDALAEGKLQAVRSRQMKELETMAANLDGTCGKKVHAHMMRILQGETI